MAQVNGRTVVLRGTGFAFVDGRGIGHWDVNFPGETRRRTFIGTLSTGEESPAMKMRDLRRWFADKYEDAL